MCTCHTSISLKYSILQIIDCLKGKSAMIIFERHANLKYKFWNRHFLAEGYYVSTVDLNTAMIRKYIREQEKEDQIWINLKLKNTYTLLRVVSNQSFYAIIGLSIPRLLGDDYKLKCINSTIYCLNFSHQGSILRQTDLLLSVRFSFS